MYLFLVPCLASWSACLFPSMFVCAFTLYTVVGCVRFLSISIIDVSIVLSAWLLCWVGCFICVLSIYMHVNLHNKAWPVPLATLNEKWYRFSTQQPLA